VRCLWKAECFNAIWILPRLMFARHFEIVDLHFALNWLLTAGTDIPMIVQLLPAAADLLGSTVFLPQMTCPSLAEGERASRFHLRVLDDDCAERDVYQGGDFQAVRAELVEQLMAHSKAALVGDAVGRPLADFCATFGRILHELPLVNAGMTLAQLIDRRGSLGPLVVPTLILGDASTGGLRRIPGDFGDELTPFFTAASFQMLEQAQLQAVRRAITEREVATPAAQQKAKAHLRVVAPGTGIWEARDPVDVQRRGRAGGLRVRLVERARSQVASRRCERGDRT
jgi:hypothetical protein